MDLIRACVVTGALLAALAAAPPAAKAAPQFWAYNASGDAVLLRDPTPIGKWVLVEFWSSRATPRRKDQRVMAALRNKFLSEDRLLLFSVCVDLEFSDWIDYVNKQEGLDDGKGGKGAFYSDRRWWQLSLGVRREEDRTRFIKAHGLGNAPAYFLICPGGKLETGNIPPEKLKGKLAKAIGERRRR